MGNDPEGNFAKIVARACAAAEALHDNTLDRTIHCSFGDFSAREYFWQITSFQALRTHDIAKVIGEEWRAIGVFGSRVTVPDDVPLQDKLLALIGRQP